MLVHGPIADSIRSPLGHPAATARGCPRVVRPLGRHALEAAATTILCFAFLHVLLRLVDARLQRDAGSLNVFTMLEAQRLWPALAAGPAAAWWSLAFALAVYGIFYAMTMPPSATCVPLPAAIERRRAAAVPIGGGSRPELNGASRNGHAAAARPPVRAGQGCTHVSPGAGLLALVGGLGVHMAALALIERYVHAFPPLPDIVHAHVPYVDFGWPGEVAYGAFLLTAIVVMFRTQPRSMPATLAMLGLFYAVRGVFLFLMPIGSPPTAPPLEARFVFWPFAAHAYFPGGHTGMMTVISLSVVSAPWRRAFLVFTFAFAIGTLLARTHYAADAFGGWLIAYAIVLWGRRHLVAHPRDGQRVEASRPSAVRQGLEVLS